MWVATTLSKWQVNPFNRHGVTTSGDGGRKFEVIAHVGGFGVGVRGGQRLDG